MNYYLSIASQEINIRSCFQDRISWYKFSCSKSKWFNWVTSTISINWYSTTNCEINGELQRDGHVSVLLDCQQLTPRRHSPIKEQTRTKGCCNIGWNWEQKHGHKWSSLCTHNWVNKFLLLVTISLVLESSCGEEIEPFTILLLKNIVIKLANYKTINIIIQLN